MTNNNYTLMLHHTRLYLINSPVVRAESLKFQESGVRDVVKDVFLPWYNAYRFLIQSVLRLQQVSILPLLASVLNHNLSYSIVISICRHLFCIN